MSPMRATLSTVASTTSGIKIVMLSCARLVDHIRGLINYEGLHNSLWTWHEDAKYAKALAEKVTDHLIEVGLGQLRRDNFSSDGIGVWIFDDIAGSDGLKNGR